MGAGAKTIVPGLGEAPALRNKHKWKAAPTARAGIVDGNPCRDDIEEAVRMVRTPTFLVNGVTSPDYEVHVVVTVDIEHAFRTGWDVARRWFTVRAPGAHVVVEAEGEPVTT